MSVLNELETYFRLAGLVLVGIGAGHIVIPRQLKWKQELETVSLMTRQVSYVHTYFIGLTCVIFGVIDFFTYDDLVSGSTLGRIVLGSFVVFWLSRLAAQAFVFESSHWNTTFLKLVNVAALCLWASLSAIHLVALITAF